MPQVVAVVVVPFRDEWWGDQSDPRTPAGPLDVVDAEERNAWLPN